MRFLGERIRKRKAARCRRNKRLAEDHRWFAWYPVKINGEYVWLEDVMRRRWRLEFGLVAGWVWEYSHTIETLIAQRDAGRP